MRILLAGPLPEPVNGCSYANDVFRRHATSLGDAFEFINTATPVISAQQGRFSWRKVYASLRCYFGLPKVFRCDVLYLTPGQTFFGLLKYAPYMELALIFRKPYVIHLHGNHLGRQFAELRGFRRKLFRRYVAGAGAGIVLSESLRRNFAELLPPVRVFVVENFAGNEIFEVDLLNKSRDSLEILWLSNLMREKGIFELLEALSRLKAEGIEFKARIAGRMESGLEEVLRRQLSVLAPAVEYLGPVAGRAKTELLMQSNVFVLPTYYTMEGQPIALLEAMASGNIIVTTCHAGIPDIVDESNGYMLPVRDVSALADCLRHIARNLPEEVRRMSARNREKAKLRFTEQAFTMKILDVLKFVLANKP